MRSDVLMITQEQVTRCSGQRQDTVVCGPSSLCPGALCYAQRGMFCLGHLGHSPPLRSQKMSGEEHKYFLTLFPLLREEIAEERVHPTSVQAQEPLRVLLALLGNREAQLLPISLHEIRRPRAQSSRLDMGWALGPRSSGLQGQMKNWNVFQVQRRVYEQKGSSYLSVMTWSTFLPGEGAEAE